MISSITCSRNNVFLSSSDVCNAYSSSVCKTLIILMLFSGARSFIEAFKFHSSTFSESCPTQYFFPKGKKGTKSNYASFNSISLPTNGWVFIVTSVKHSG